MNTSQLQCFVSLAGTLNYVKTADQLGMTQPSVSKQIQALEQEMGAALFFRTTRSVSLTQIGTQFLPEAVSMLNTYYHSKEWISGFSRTARQPLRIGYSDPHSIHRISQVLRQMMKLHENLVPELIYDQTDANLSKLKHSQLDLIVSMRDARYSDDQIVFRKLKEETFVCVISRFHAFAVSTSGDSSFSGEISTRDIQHIRQVILIPPYLMTNYFTRGLKIVPVNDELDNIICNNANEAYGLVIAGAGYAFIPRHLVIDHPDLEFWKWKETPLAPFGLYYRKTQAARQNIFIKDFIQTAKTIYADDTLPLHLPSEQ